MGPRFGVWHHFASTFTALDLPKQPTMFNPTKAKVQLKLSVNRLQMLQNKRNMLAQQQRKEIARLLEAGKEESARIRVPFVSVA